MITYNVNIPDAPNNPSNDQPLMQTNTNAIDTILGVDHVSFNITNPPDGGTHKQVTFSTKNAPGAQTDPQSVLYTGSGTASTISQLLFRNQNGTFQISTTRAWALCDAAGIVSTQSINVSSVTRNSAGNYSIVLTANAVSTINFAILTSCTRRPFAGTPPMSSNYSITGIGTFDLFFYDLFASTLQDPTTFSFEIIQI